jgi:flagellar basal-body rod modification protein FlgD
MEKTMSETISALERANISQADYLKLFMQELTYQDPLNPIDNRDFMAQMAQFSALQEAQATSNSLQVLAALVNEQLSLTLLGKKVRLTENGQEGVVHRIEFLPHSAPTLEVLVAGKLLTIPLTDIQSVA